MNRYFLETDRLGLRPFTKDDVDNLHGIYSDPDTMKFMMKVLTKKEETLSWLEWNDSRYEKNGFGHWAVELKDNKTLIGKAGLHYSMIENKNEVEMAWMIHSKYWGNGFATEAAVACRDYAFQKLGIKTLYASLSLENVASVSVAEKIGMTYQGTMVHRETPDTPVYSVTFNHSLG